jgi:hypothetical protein
MLVELSGSYGVETFVAVLKAVNHRSEGLLRSLGFEAADPGVRDRYRDGPDEAVMVRAAACG